MTLDALHRQVLEALADHPKKMTVMAVHHVVQYGYYHVSKALDDMHAYDLVERSGDRQYWLITEAGRVALA